MDSVTISVLALIVSIGVPVFEFLYNRKINSINIDAQYYDEIYKEYLIVKIPEFRMKIERTNDGNVYGINEFIELLREIRKKSLYFKFANEDFYKELYKLLQDMEDEFVLLEDRLNDSEFAQFQMKIEPMIYELYKCIHDASHGKNVFES